MAAAAAVDFKKLLQKPLVVTDDMPAELASEVIELVTSAVDKFLATDNFEKASQTLKDSLDRKFGPSWQVAIGEGFSFSVTYNSHSLLYLLYGEKLGILVFKV